MTQVVKEEDAKQGVTRKRVRIVLGVSLVLAIVAMAVVAAVVI